MLAAFVFVLAASASARSGYFLWSGSQSAILKVIRFQGKNYAVTDHEVFRQEGHGAAAILRTDATIKAALVYNDKLLLATTKGVHFFDGKTDVTRWPADEISSLATDAQHRLWIGKTYHGAYTWQGADSLQMQLSVPSLLSLAATPDGYTWAGTNVGLYRLAPGGGYIRYAEEGYSGYELPDNIVEEVYADALSNVWISMPDHLSFKKGSEFAGELPAFEYLGSRENELHKVLLLDKKFYLFITKQGISALPIQTLAEAHEHATEEVHNSHGAKAIGLSGHLLQVPDELAGQKVLTASVADGKVHFATARGSWSVPEKRLAKRLRGI